MRVALVRGSLLKPWELPNYVIDGVDVDVFASRRVAGELDPAVLPVVGLPSVAETVARLSPRLRGIVDLTAGPLERLTGLERAVRGYDVVHALELVQPFTVQAIRARDAGACRAVVATVMENIPFTPSPNPVVARRAAEAARGVDLFLAITERARLHLQTAGVEDERITVLPLGIDTDRFAPPEEPARRGEDGPLRILCVSRLEVGKGVEDLAIACGLLARRGVAATVTFVGEGPSRGRIEHIAAQMGVADRITFTGGVAWDELQRVHHDHDVFVLASAPTRNWREQFGFAVVEAMAAGLPVVAGESGSLMEVVGHRPEALVAPHDPLTLADRLAALAGDPALRRELGAFNRARAVEHYDLRVIRAGLREAYERAVSAASASRSRSPIGAQS
jgi:glycosyltransferase involved in cell wall biosynthesis